MPHLEEHTAALARRAQSCISSRSTQLSQLREHTYASARASRSTQQHQREEHTAASAQGAHSGTDAWRTQMHQLEEHKDTSARRANRSKALKHYCLCHSKLVTAHGSFIFISIESPNFLLVRCWVRTLQITITSISVGAQNFRLGIAMTIRYRYSNRYDDFDIDITYIFLVQ